MCPECGSDNVSVVEYDFSRCPETGYHDAGERDECHDCGAYGDVDTSNWKKPKAIHDP